MMRKPPTALRPAGSGEKTGNQPAPRTSSMRAGNLFLDAEPPVRGETFETLLAHNNLVVERIVSSAENAPAEYVQRQDEWVVLIRGTAVLSMAGEAFTLAAGDYLFIPAGVSHRVEKTSNGALWLVLHLHPPPAAA